MSKKCMAIVLLVVVLVMSFPSFSLAAEARTVKIAKGTPVIDASKDKDIWDSSELMNEFVQSGVKLTTFNADIQPSARILWDEKNLYVFAYVIDAKVGGTATGKENYQNDAIEVYIDQNNAKTAKYEGDDMCVVIDYQGNVYAYGKGENATRFYM